MSNIVIDRLVQTFGEVRAIDDVSFTVADREFVTLLGPSGCGKSTTLFSIAGLERPSSGRITVGDSIYFDSGRSIHLPPEKRNCGLVFQSYALWPHKTVLGNVEFPLKIRGVKAADRQARALEALAIVDLEAYGARYPHELSGGQQQRVALARTLVYAPSVLLLDEPLSNLDAKLRSRARSWLKMLQSKLKITTVFVTHDQAEALSLSDRIIVMEAGRIRQVGTPEEIYRRPATAFVADFIGGSNLLPARIHQLEADAAIVRLSDGQQLRVPRSAADSLSGEVTISVRPEKLRLVEVNGARPDTDNLLRGRVQNCEYLGGHYQYEVSVGEHLMRFNETRKLADGDLALALDRDDCLVFARP